MTNHGIWPPAAKYPFADRLYAHALDVLGHLGSFGPTVVLTDGDAVFQPHKVERAGIAAAVDRHVLVYGHKELELDDVERRYPSDRYVFVDDKPRILAAAKGHWGARVTTVLDGRLPALTPSRLRTSRWTSPSTISRAVHATSDASSGTSRSAPRGRARAA